MTDQEREALTLTEALIFARSELHRALLERGSTVGYRASFARINAALAICEEPATTELLSICHGAVVRHGGTGAARYYVCSECGEACGLAAREEPHSGDADFAAWCSEIPKETETRTRSEGNFRGSYVEERRFVTPWERVRAWFADTGEPILVGESESEEQLRVEAEAQAREP